MKVPDYTILSNRNRKAVNGKLRRNEGFLIIGKFGPNSFKRADHLDDFQINVFKSCRIEDGMWIQGVHTVMTNRGEQHKDDIYFDVRRIRSLSKDPMMNFAASLFTTKSIRNVFEIKSGVMASVGQIAVNLDEDCVAIFIPWKDGGIRSAFNFLIDHFTKILNKNMRKRKSGFQFSEKDKRKIFDYMIEELKTRKDSSSNFSAGEEADIILEG